MMSDLMVWFHSEAKEMIFICNVTLATWGYLVASVRMWRNLKSSMGEMFFNRTLDPDSMRVKLLFVLMCSASCFGIIKFSLSLYTAVGEYGVFADIGYV